MIVQAVEEEVVVEDIEMVRVAEVDLEEVMAVDGDRRLGEVEAVAETDFVVATEVEGIVEISPETREVDPSLAMVCAGFVGMMWT